MRVMLLGNADGISHFCELGKSVQKPHRKLQIWVKKGNLHDEHFSGKKFENYLNRYPSQLSRSKLHGSRVQMYQDDAKSTPHNSRNTNWPSGAV